MTPNAPKLVVAHHLIPCHPQSVCDFALLLDREEDVALHTKH